MEPKYFLFSTISGTNISESMKNLKKHIEKDNKKAKFFKVESKIENMMDFLQKPFHIQSEEILNCLDKTIESAQKINDIDYVLISFHPVLIHQSTGEFVTPYVTSEILKILDKRNIKFERIISIHDDIYDIYKNLLEPEKLFNPDTKCESKAQLVRNLLEEIDELQQILGWRDRELMVSKNISLSIKTKHLLFHNKGRVNSLYNIICKEEPCIYLSHPISQVRRDILEIPDNNKNKFPNPKRGKKLQSEIASFSNYFGSFFPIIEPTCIDELRINDEKKDKFNENELSPLESINPNDLKTSILPPLTERWEIGEEQRLSIGHSKEINGLFQIEKEIFKDYEFNITKNDIQKTSSAIKILKNKILRQINRRDRTLAYQADLVLVFRPFVHPDSPEPTGGVGKEIQTALFKAQEKEIMCKPAIFIVMSKKDEIERRKKAFRAFIETIKENLEIVEPKEFEEDILSILSDLTKEKSVVKHEIEQCIKLHRVKYLVKQLDTSMADGHLAKIDENRNKLVDKILHTKNIFQSEVAKHSEDNPEIVQIYFADDLTVENSEEDFSNIKSKLSEIVKLFKNKKN